MKMGKENACRICEKKCSRNFANLFDSKVKVFDCENYMISYFEAMQQLTGMEIDYGANVSNCLCWDCQTRIKLAYKIRGELIKALEKETKTNIKVYQIVTKSDGNDSKNVSGGSIVHEELVEITEVDEDYNLDILPSDHTEYLKSKDEIENTEVDYLQENEMVIDDSAEDAVSFLLEKKELFKVDDASNKGRGRRSHKCEVCEKTFIRKSNLVDHLRLHANVRLYKCEYCEKEFVQAGNYRSHLRIHTKERPYKCSMCPKTYNQSSALKVHIRSHTNEKNYICPTCKKGFTNSSDLNKHTRVHDPSLKIKCEYCDKMFAQRVNLKNHIMRHHSNINTSTKSIKKAKK